MTSFITGARKHQEQPHSKKYYNHHSYIRTKRISNEISQPVIVSDINTKRPHGDMKFLISIEKYFTSLRGSLVKYVSTQEEKFHMSKQPCNI